MNDKPIELSVIVPLYNEERTIIKILNRLNKLIFIHKNNNYFFNYILFKNIVRFIKKWIKIYFLNVIKG